MIRKIDFLVIGLYGNIGRCLQLKEKIEGFFCRLVVCSFDYEWQR